MTTAEVAPASSAAGPDATARVPPRVLVAVGLVAGTTLALQVLLTRVLSAVLFYHFGFLAISLALLGAGSGAIMIYVRPAWFERRTLEATMARLSALYAVAILAIMLVVVRVNYTYPGSVTTGFAARLALVCVLAAIPFLIAGIVIALAVRGYTREIGRVYAADLAGAGVGAVGVVPLMWLVDAPTLVVALGLVAALASLLLAGPGAVRERPIALAALAVAVVLTALSATTALYFLPPGQNGAQAAADRWTPLSRVVGFLPPGDKGSGLIVYDRVLAEVVRHSRSAPIPDWRTLVEGPQSIGYALTGPGRALVIGGGGGRDILNALSSGQRQVDVIELNRGIRDVVDQELRALSGSPYTLPRVSTAIGDGRSTLAERDTHYDTIHIGFTDTLSANAAQAFALTENNLYTEEALDEYLDHLAPGGVLNLSRPVQQLGEEALRATVLTVEALKRRGVADPRRNVMVVLGTYHRVLYGTVLARLTPYTPQEVALVRRLASERGEGVAMAPGGPYYGPWRQLAATNDPQSFCEHYHANVCPPTDDKPFFFNTERIGDVFGAGMGTPQAFKAPDPLRVLLLTLAILVALALVAFVLPLLLVRGAVRPGLGSVSFFAAIGLGFIVLEVVLIQRFVLFLGFPTYALSVVLFALLLFTGLGAFLSTRMRGEPRSTLAAALIAACVLMLVAAFGLQPLLATIIDLPFAARVVLTVAMLAPLAIPLGMAMPLGLGRLSALYPGGVPWAWGVNGIASVVGSALAVAVAILYGFEVATLVAFVCYLCALVHVLIGRWPTNA